MKIFLPFIAALVLAPLISSAQTPTKPEPPSGPLVTQPPDPSTVIITFSYPQERAAKSSGAPAPALGSEARMVTITKTGDVIHKEIVDGLGTKVSAWEVNGNDYSKAPDSESWSQAEHASHDGGQISNLGWINRGNYVGAIKYAGRDCLVFVDGAPPKFDIAEAMAQQKLDGFRMVAFVDKETRLPIEDHAFGVYRYFRFGDAPAGKQAPPPDLAQQIQRGKEMMDRLSHRDPPPE